jgi:SNF2 family DNA or RNA helicase
MAPQNPLNSLNPLKPSYPQIGDEMGLGKTVQACALLWCYRDEWPAIIIAPSSLR